MYSILPLNDIYPVRIPVCIQSAMMNIYSYIIGPMTDPYYGQPKSGPHVEYQTPIALNVTHMNIPYPSIVDTLYPDT